MIPTILRIAWLNIRRDRVVWLLTFVIPVVFFSVFAVIFGGMGRGGTSRVHITVVDEDQSKFSRRLETALENEASLRVVKKEDASPNREQAAGMVRMGDVPVAVILPKGFGVSFGHFDNQAPAIEILADTSDPVAPQIVSGLLQKVVMTAAPDALMEAGIDELKRWGGPLTDAQRKAVEVGLEQLRKDGQNPENAAAVDEQANVFSGIVPVRVVDLLGEKKANPLVAYYAAATAVMFLLFSCANGAGGALLEEEETGTLDRLLSSNLTMSQLLAGKWLSLTILGIAQVTLMFLWGALVFRLELWRHAAGFALMTAATAAAGAAFGLVLATICRSRGQLSAISTTVILIMSAVGGSMVPRFVMSETLQKLGLLTFNGWALEGYTKVFWREAPVWDLWPQLVVLTLLTVVFLITARILARRWEVA